MKQTILDFSTLQLLPERNSKAGPVPRVQMPYFVYMPKQLFIGCFIMAENIHHAANKALKHWGPEIIVAHNKPEGITEVPQTKFTKLLKAWRSK